LPDRGGGGADLLERVARAGGRVAADEQAGAGEDGDGDRGG
jgi:hypothetical protein